MRIKPFLKEKVAVAMRRMSGQKTDRVVVLCYHSVHPSKRLLATRPETFEQHLCWIKHHCQVISFRDALAVRQSGELACPKVAITFDDGYADNYEYAFPLLQKYGLPATFFVTTGLLEREEGVIARFDSLVNGPWEDNTPLTWEQVREMRAAGFDFGAHTHRHPSLACLNAEEAAFELAQAKLILEQRLGERITLLAYPFGKRGRHYTAESVALAAKAGYEQAAAVCFRGCRSSDHPLQVPRFFVADDGLSELADKVYGAWDPIGWLQDCLPMLLAKILSPADFNYGG